MKQDIKIFDVITYNQPRPDAPTRRGMVVCIEPLRVVGLDGLGPHEAIYRGHIDPSSVASIRYIRKFTQHKNRPCLVLWQLFDSECRIYIPSLHHTLRVSLKSLDDCSVKAPMMYLHAHL